MTNILSQSEVAAIRERAAKATLGPWERHVYQSGTVSVATAGKQFLDVCHVRQVTCDDDMRWREVETAAAQAERRANAVFVAASRADVPALCDTVDALRAKLEVAKAALESCKAALGDNMRSQGLGGKGITKDYAGAVVGEINSALASLKEPQ